MPAIAHFIRLAFPQPNELPCTHFLNNSHKSLPHANTSMSTRRTHSSFCVPKPCRTNFQVFPSCSWRPYLGHPVRPCPLRCGGADAPTYPTQRQHMNRAGCTRRCRGSPPVRVVQKYKHKIGAPRHGCPMERRPARHSPNVTQVVGGGHEMNGAQRGEQKDERPRKCYLSVCNVKETSQHKPSNHVTRNC